MSKIFFLQQTPNTTSSNASIHELAVALTLATLLAITWLIYQPAIPGFFMLDDFDNLGALKGGVIDLASLQHYLAIGNAGPLGRPIAKLSFLLDDHAWPSSPENFKRNNLLIHLLVGVLVFACCRLMTRQWFSARIGEWLALAIAAVWLAHPFQVSTVMYVIQRMTQLASLFVMAGVLTHLWLRLKYPQPNLKELFWLSLSLGTFTLAATFSKESGVLLPVFLLVIELTVLSKSPTSRLLTWWRRLCLLLPSLGLIAYLCYWPRWANSYASRDFSFTERILTQPVILLDYLGSILSLRVAGLGLFHDDYPTRSSLTDPTALAALLLIAAALLFAILYRKRFPLLSFGILWYLAGHLLESTTISLELYFEHRNYLPLLGPALALVIGAYRGLAAISGNLARMSPVFAALILTIASLTTWGYANEWGAPERILTIWATEHPNSPRAQRTYAQLQAGQGHAEAALDTLDEAYRRFPHDLSIPLMSIDIACAMNHPQRYRLEELADITSIHRWTDGLRPVMQSMFGRILDNECRNQTSALHSLVMRLPELDNGEHLRSGIAAFFVLDGDLYLREGNGNGALNSYQIVDELVPSASSMLRIAGLYLQVKDYANARQALLIAHERETATGTKLSSLKQAQYREKFSLIARLQAAHEAPRDQETR